MSDSPPKPHEDCEVCANWAARQRLLSALPNPSLSVIAALRSRKPGCPEFSPSQPEEDGHCHVCDARSLVDDDQNPKDKVGALKPTLVLFPPSAIIIGSECMKDGKEKYGAYNWREKQITASEYVSPAIRHLLAWWDGEEMTRDSNLPHLGAALATIAILIDAMENGNLKDDRPVPGPAADLLEKLTRKP